MRIRIHRLRSRVSTRRKTTRPRPHPRGSSACMNNLSCTAIRRKRRFPCLTRRDVAFKVVCISLTAISSALSSKHTVAPIPILGSSGRPATSSRRSENVFILRQATVLIFFLNKCDLTSRRALLTVSIRQIIPRTTDSLPANVEYYDPGISKKEKRKKEKE